MNRSKTFSIEPWLSLDDGKKALDFYKSAFGAVETYRLDDDQGGLVARLSVNGAGFWISSDANAESKVNAGLGGKNIRMILIVDDPDALYARALKAGATEIFPVGEDHGWRLGRLTDPFGLDWELGYQMPDVPN